VNGGRGSTSPLSLKVPTREGRGVYGKGGGYCLGWSNENKESTRGKREVIQGGGYSRQKPKDGKAEIFQLVGLQQAKKQVIGRKRIKRQGFKREDAIAPRCLCGEEVHPLKADRTSQEDNSLPKGGGVSPKRQEGEKNIVMEVGITSEILLEKN